MIKMLRYRAGTKAFCSYCEDHVFTFCVDIFSGDKMLHTQVSQNEGQAPWNFQDRLICRKCNEPLDERHLIFTPPMIIDEVSE